MRKIIFKITCALEFGLSALCGLGVILVLIDFISVLTNDGQDLGTALSKALGIILLPLFMAIFIIIGVIYLIFAIKTLKYATKELDTYNNKRKTVIVCLVFEIILLVIASLVIVFNIELCGSVITWVLYIPILSVVVMKIIGKILAKREKNLI